MMWQRHFQELISRADEESDSRGHHGQHGQYEDKRLPHREEDE